ncbi:MAG: molecular chaperone TorD family protein [Deferribacteraceae bacterium]|nr:molecular chaperone TorD family protein [Deferribacteraceae bacterium]
MNGRENYYRFLAELYKIEITPKMLESFEHLIHEPFADTAMREGYQLIKRYFDNNPFDPLTELAVDYARIFLGAGIAEKELISAPYESVYTSPERLIMQDARDKVLKIYRENGVDKVQGFDVPEDHLAIELEFMAYLCSETKKACEAGNLPEIDRLICIQKDFIKEHLLNWTPKLFYEVKQFSQTDFYRGVAEITESFLNTDKYLLDDIFCNEG